MTPYKKGMGGEGGERQSPRLECGMKFTNIYKQKGQNDAFLPYLIIVKNLGTNSFCPNIRFFLSLVCRRSPHLHRCNLRRKCNEPRSRLSTSCPSHYRAVGLLLLPFPSVHTARTKGRGGGGGGHSDIAPSHLTSPAPEE